MPSIEAEAAHVLNVKAPSSASEAFLGYTHACRQALGRLPLFGILRKRYGQFEAYRPACGKQVPRRKFKLTLAPLARLSGLFGCPCAQPWQVPCKPKPKARLPRKGKLVKKPITLKSFGTVSLALNLKRKLLTVTLQIEECSELPHGLARNTYRCVDLGTPVLRMSNGQMLFGSTCLQDVATQIYFWSDYKKECNSKILKRGKFLNPIVAEFMAGKQFTHIHQRVSLNGQGFRICALRPGIPKGWSLSTPGSVTKDSIRKVAPWLVLEAWPIDSTTGDNKSWTLEEKGPRRHNVVSMFSGVLGLDIALHSLGPQTFYFVSHCFLKN